MLKERMSGWGGMICIISFTRTIRRRIAPREVLLPMDKTLKYFILERRTTSSHYATIKVRCTLQQLYILFIREKNIILQNCHKEKLLRLSKDSFNTEEISRSGYYLDESFVFLAQETRLYIEDWIGLKTLDEAQQMIKAVPSYNRLSTIKNFSMEVVGHTEDQHLLNILLQAQSSYHHDHKSKKKENK